MRASNIRLQRWVLVVLLLVSTNGFAQWKDYMIGKKGDTLNRVDLKGRQQGPWVLRQEAVRGERGFEEEGMFQDGWRVGPWRRYSLEGDLLGVENYRYGMKDGKQVYFNLEGKPVREEMWRAVDPQNPYDTVPVRDLQNPNIILRWQVVKVEPVSRKHGTWKYYDERDGRLETTQEWVMDKLKKEGEDELTPITPAAATDQNTVKSVREAELAKRPAYEKKEKVSKPPAIVEFEKKHSGKKKYQVRDGATGG